MKPPNLNRPTGASIHKLAEEIDQETQTKRVFKGIRGGRKASAAVKAGRRIRKQNRGGRK